MITNKISGQLILNHGRGQVVLNSPMDAVIQDLLNGKSANIRI